MKRFSISALIVALCATVALAGAGQKPNQAGPTQTMVAIPPASNGAGTISDALARVSQDAATAAKPNDVAKPADSTDSRVRAATEALANKLRELQAKLKDRPSKVEPGAWTDPIKVSEDLLTKVREVRKLRDEILNLTGQVNAAGGVSRTELSKLREIFAALKTQAEDEVSGADGSSPLPEQLVAAVRREIGALDQGINACDGTIRWAADVVSRHKDAVSVISRSGSMLGRMEVAAESFHTLALLGQQLESLDASMKEFSMQLDACLSTLDSLAYETQKAVDQLGPPAPLKKPTV